MLGLVFTGIAYIHEGIYSGIMGVFGMSEKDQGFGLVFIQFLSCFILACLIIIPPAIVCISIKKCLTPRGEVRRRVPPRVERGNLQVGSIDETVDDEEGQQGNQIEMTVGGEERDEEEKKGEEEEEEKDENSDEDREGEREDEEI